MAASLFSERLERRHRTWWGRGRPPLSFDTYRDALHRNGERHRFRSRGDSPDTWRCCDQWPRALLNKWNSREFAASHGCRLPALYWHGLRLSGLPLESLPARFVIRPIWGTGRRGIFVMADGCDLLRGDRPTPARLRQRVRWAPPALFSWADRILIEEFVGNRDPPRLPVEYKCHTFGDRVAAVEMLERTGAHTATHRYYSPTWEPYDDAMCAALPAMPLRPAPAGLHEMVTAAGALGASLGTYMRVDFFASDEGCVFNEFSSTPFGAPTPFCDALFGRLWEEACPAAT